jgi:CheY-like chemotaxis protein
VTTAAHAQGHAAPATTEPGDRAPAAGAPPAPPPAAPRTAAEARARGAFLAALSHELRTPLAGVLGFTELLADTRLDAWQRESVTAIHECGEELLAQLDNVLDAAALEAGELVLERVPCALNGLVAAALAPLARKARERHLDFGVAFAPDAPARVLADPARLTQVLAQLVGNAIKFTDAGRVAVDVGCVSADARRWLRIAVSDSGVGVPPAARAALFGSRAWNDGAAEAAPAGMGFGLAICRALVELMGGTIGVDSVPGAGSTFWFCLPLDAAAAATDDAPRPPRAAPPAAHVARVLLAEDNPVDRKITARLLELRGCRVDVAANGAEAAAGAGRTRYDLVLMDCRMPVMDGLDAARAIRRLEATAGSAPTTIVALTASPLRADRERCHAAGMDAVLAKPVDPAALAAVLESLTAGPARPAAATAADPAPAEDRSPAPASPAPHPRRSSWPAR